MAKNSEQESGASVQEAGRRIEHHELSDPEDAFPAPQGQTRDEGADEIERLVGDEWNPMSDGDLASAVAEEARHQGKMEDEEPPASPEDGEPLEDAEGEDPDRVRLEELGVDPSETTIEIQVDGESQEVSLEEAAKGYQRHSDYTRKTQEVADARRELREAREQVAGDLEALSMLGDQLGPQQRQALAAKYEQYKAAEQAHRAEHLSGERERLQEALDWQSSGEAQEGAQQLRSYLTSEYGYADDDLANVGDHRVMILAEKARRYDEMQGKMEQARYKVKKSQSPTLKPGVATSETSNGQERQYQDARRRLGRSGSVRDAAAAIDASGILGD